MAAKAILGRLSIPQLTRAKRREGGGEEGGRGGRKGKGERGKGGGERYGGLGGEGRREGGEEEGRGGAGQRGGELSKTVFFPGEKRILVPGLSILFSRVLETMLSE